MESRVKLFKLIEFFNPLSLTFSVFLDSIFFTCYFLKKNSISKQRRP